MALTSIPQRYKCWRMAKKNATTEFLRNRDTWIRFVIENPFISHASSRVGVHLAMRMTAEQQFCWPSIATISKVTGVSKRSVLHALDQLVDEGALIRDSRRNVGSKYSMLFKWL